MELKKGCLSGVVNLQKYFQIQLEREYGSRKHAIMRTRSLAKVTIEMDCFKTCPYLDCMECPKKIFLGRLSRIGVFSPHKKSFKKWLEQS